MYELAGRLMTSPALPEDEELVEDESAAVPVPEALLVLANVVVMVELPEVMVETMEVTEAVAELLSPLLSAAPVAVGVPAVPLK